MMKRLGICIAGLNGAVASTIAAGVFLMRRGLARPQAMLSEAWRERLGLVPLDQLVIGGWDVRGERLLESALRNRVVEPHRLQAVAKEMAATVPWVVPRRWPSNSYLQLARDIERFRRERNLDSIVVLNLLPTGRHRDSGAFARAAAATGLAFINFTPNDCDEERLTRIPFCGKDGKTGQTWLKSVLAPAFRACGLRVTGWYSTNLLGNEDGRVVSDPKRGKPRSKQDRNCWARSSVMRRTIRCTLASIRRAATTRKVGTRLTSKDSLATDATEDQRTLARFGAGRANVHRLGSVHGIGAAAWRTRCSGVAELLLQIALQEWGSTCARIPSAGADAGRLLDHCGKLEPVEH